MTRSIQQESIVKLPQTGGCQCGKIRYEITEAPQSVYACHCRDCQRLTSSAFSMGLVVAEAAFKLSGVEPRPLQRLRCCGRTSGGWQGPRARRHARRYLVAPADPTYLDP